MPLPVVATFVVVASVVPEEVEEDVVVGSEVDDPALTVVEGESTGSLKQATDTASDAENA